MRARLCIGGVLLLLESPSQLLEAAVAVFGDFARLLPGPTEASSFYVSAGTLTKSSRRSIFIIVLVGMFGVSFSKPPCMKMVESMAQMLWRNRYRLLNFRHSLDSVS